MSHRMCDPRNRSALTRNGSLGVRRKFCLIRAFVMAAVGLSKIDTKLGLRRIKKDELVLLIYSKYWKSAENWKFPSFCYEMQKMTKENKIITFDGCSNDQYRLVKSLMNLVLHCVIVCRCLRCPYRGIHHECLVFANDVISFVREQYDLMLLPVA